MLKIKPEIDLKELEKFGFRNVFYKNYVYTTKVNIGINEIWVDGDTRKIYIVDYANDLKFIVDESLDKLFKLIQAGLVEKVSE